LASIGVLRHCFTHPLILTMLLTTFTYKAAVLGAITLVQYQKAHLCLGLIGNSYGLRSWQGWPVWAGEKCFPACRSTGQETSLNIWLQ